MSRCCSRSGEPSATGWCFAILTPPFFIFLFRGDYKKKVLAAHKARAMGDEWSAVERLLCSVNDHFSRHPAMQAITTSSITTSAITTSAITT